MRKRNPEYEARRSSLIALFCLHEQDLSGYMLRKRLEDWHITDTLSISPSTIYRALDRLEAENALCSKVKKNKNYPESRIYKLTPKGRALYKKLLREEAKFDPSSHSLLAFIGLASYMTVKERIGLAKKWQQAASVAIESLQKQIDDHREGIMYGKPFAEWLLCDHERHILKSEILWLDNYIKILQNS